MRVQNVFIKDTRIVGGFRISFFAVIVLLLLLYPSPVLSDSTSTESNVTIARTTLMNLIAFNVTPGSIYLGQSLSFYVKVQNTGNLNVTGFTVEVNISPGNSSEQRNYTGTAVPGQNVTVVIPGYLPSATGSYNSTAVGYYANTTLETNGLGVNFTVLPAPIATPSPTQPPAGGPASGGGSGGPGPLSQTGLNYTVMPPEKIEVPKVAKAPEGSADIASFPVLVEPFLGEVRSVSVLVKNPWARQITNDIVVTGLPDEWLTLSSRRLLLNPGESKYVTVTMAIPDNAFTGNYQMKFKIGDNTVVSAVRVKYYDVRQSVPATARTVYVNYAEGEFTVSLSVRNGGLLRRTIEVVEEIPKQLAETAGQVEFMEGTPEIVREDPVVMWRLKDMEPGEERTLSYRGSMVPDDFSVFGYWKLQQLNVVAEQLLGKIRIINLKAPPLFPGKMGQLYFRIQSTFGEALALNISLEMVGGGDWKLEPAKVEMTLEPGMVGPVLFTFTTPSDKFMGAQPAVLRIAGADWENVEYLVFPVGIGFLEGMSVSFSTVNWPAGALFVLMLVGGAFLFRGNWGRRQEMHRISEMYLSKARSEIFRHISIRDEAGEGEDKGEDENGKQQ